MTKIKDQESFLFGFKSQRSTSQIVLLKVPWEVTTSYGGGTSLGPKAIYEASSQLDLFDLELGLPYKAGFYLKPDDRDLIAKNKRLKKMAQKIIQANEKSAATSADGAPINLFKKKSPLHDLLHQVNRGCNEMVNLVYLETQEVIEENKIPGLIGGDHSTPLGAIQALAEHLNGDMGVLHIDAHADLRYEYQGFKHSHASIMRNVSLLQIRPQKLVQVGIRDFCEEEYNFIQENSSFVTTHFDLHLKQALHKGENWHALCEKIIKPLPQNVYVSFDIDGLSPDFCPNTGTPVPGGMSYDQAMTLLSVLGNSGKRIIGFDLNEVAPGKDSDWDANVGARILYKLCGWAVKTNSAQ